MNVEEEGLVIPKEQPSLEELEKKYFKKNANFYTSKQSDTNFDRFELSEKDLQVLRSQLGDQEEGLPPPNDQEVLMTGTTDNPVNLRQLRAESQPTKRAWWPKISWKLSTDSLESQVYLFIYLNFAIAMYSICYHLFVNLTLSLFLCYFSRLMMFCWFRVMNSDQRVEVDLFVLLWPPFRQVILALVFPHMNWSPTNPTLNESYTFLLTLLLVGNYYLMRRYFSAAMQD